MFIPKRHEQDGMFDRTGNPVADRISDFIQNVVVWSMVLVFIAGVFFTILAIFGIDV
jgi:hypothetical protein